MYDPDKYSDVPQTPQQEKVFEQVKQLRLKHSVGCRVHFKIPIARIRMKKKLKHIMLTLQYALETLQENCQCGECDPCTAGQKDLETAITEIQEVGNKLGFKTLI